MELIEERRKILLNTPHIETASTNTFKTDMVAPFKKLEARFEAEQSGSGDPSLDNVRPIEGRKELIVRHSGVNIWDEEWELGSLNNSTGEKVSSSSSIRAKNFIPVRPNTQYYFPNLDGYVLQYDQNKGYIGILSNRNTKPTDATCYYLKFRLSTNYGTVYKNDYSINYPATVTEYEPYIEAGYPIGKNLLNAEAVTSRKYINAGGVPTDSRNGTGYLSYTDFIPVSEGEAYTISVSGKDSGANTGAFNWFTDKDLTTIMSTRSTYSISTAESYSATNIAPVGAKFLIVNFVAGTENQIEQGSSPTAYESYQGIGYKVSWGKNLLDVENIFMDTKNYVVNEDKSITILQSNGNAWTSNLVPSVSLNAGTYTFSRTNPVGATIIRSSADNYASDIARLSAGDYSKTFTLTGDAIIKFKVNTGSTATFPNTTFIQIELGSEASEYQPYVGEVYGGTVDLVSGTLTVDMRYLTVSDFSLWGGNGVSGGGLHWVNLPKTYPTALNSNDNICSHAEYLIENAWLASIPAFTTNAGGFPARIYVSSNSFADFQTEYASLQVAYRLETPITYQLTPQQILTLKNNNTLMPEGSINELKYWTHI